MPLNPRARRPAGVPVVIALSLATLPAASRAAQVRPAYQVVLKDGSVLVASTRPLIALGKVSFLDGEHHGRTLAVTAVDVEATRERMGPAPTSRRWTDSRLRSVRGSIQIVGESEAPQEVVKRPGEVTEADLANMTQAERIRAEIDRLDDKIKPLDPRDRQRSVLMIRQLELQQELARVLSPPVQS